MIKRLTAYWKYFCYVVEHKRNAAKACRKRGLYLHALTHDLSKFLPWEFFPYAHFFYLDKEKYKKSFDRAWKRHYTFNQHHWNYWLTEESIADMSGYAIECMIADWEGMSMKFGGSAAEFYLKNYKKIKLSYSSRLTLEHRLGINDSDDTPFPGTLEELAKRMSAGPYNKIFGDYILQQHGVDSYELLRGL